MSSKDNVIDLEEYRFRRACQYKGVNDEERRKERARELGLPETASWDDIENKGREKSSSKKALELGLPEDSSWSDIYMHSIELDRQRLVRELGLPEDTGWVEIRKHL